MATVKTSLRKDKLRAAVIHRDGFVCFHCGVSPRDAAVGHVFFGVAHIVPRNHAGAWRIENMALLCPACHALSHTRAGRAMLLREMQERYGYTYDGEWARLLAEFYA